MWDYLLQLDYWIFNFINQSLSFDLLDRIMPIWRSKFFWLPLYIILLTLIAQTFGKRAWWIYVGIGLTIFLADTMSSKLIKKNIERQRPCRTEVLAKDINVLVRCGSGYSFTSSHATNHFALAVFLIITLGSHYCRMKWWLLTWAASIALGQVYVGVHFPSDVVAGSLVGALIGYLVGYVVMERIKPKGEHASPT